MTTFVVDQKTQFGRWDDPTSRLIYFDAMPAMLNGVVIPAFVIDMGGGNGILRKWIPHSVSVDVDAAKQPDIVADITIADLGAMVPLGALVVMRYLLHYLPDDDVAKLFRNLAATGADRVLVVQFVNDDLAAKQRNSANETKWFRNERQLVELIHPWKVAQRKALEYEVTAEFYKNRLGLTEATPHRETILSLELSRP